MNKNVLKPCFWIRFSISTFIGEYDVQGFSHEHNLPLCNGFTGAEVSSREEELKAIPKWGWVLKSE